MRCWHGNLHISEAATLEALEELSGGTRGWWGSVWGPGRVWAGDEEQCLGLCLCMLYVSSGAGLQAGRALAGWPGCASCGVRGHCPAKLCG